MTDKKEILDCTDACAIQDNEIPDIDSLCEAVHIEESAGQAAIIHVLRAEFERIGMRR